MRYVGVSDVDDTTTPTRRSWFTSETEDPVIIMVPVGNTTFGLRGPTRGPRDPAVNRRLSTNHLVFEMIRFPHRRLSGTECGRLGRDTAYRSLTGIAHWESCVPERVVPLGSVGTSGLQGSHNGGKDWGLVGSFDTGLQDHRGTRSGSVVVWL